MKVGVLVFPGSWSHDDFLWVLREVLGVSAEAVWHKETSVAGCDALVLPGGFAHGDYLRAGAIARFSPVMPAVRRFAEAGGLVLGSCNGFQILCEAGLLPGALLRNDSLQYRCQWVHLRVENPDTGFTPGARRGQVLAMPISHGEGRYVAEADTLRALEARGQIVFRYCAPDGRLGDGANPNGSLGHIAGIVNAGGNVLGLMPHPERAAEAVVGGADGLALLRGLVGAAARRLAAPAR
jgi:phosphoribosylformylglycinamidine synthase